MTTISAGAAAGLLVALMVVATGESRGAELLAGPAKSAQDGQLRPDIQLKPASQRAA